MSARFDDDFFAHAALGREAAAVDFRSAAFDHGPNAADLRNGHHDVAPYPVTAFRYRTPSGGRVSEREW